MKTLVLVAGVVVLAALIWPLDPGRYLAAMGVVSVMLLVSRSDG